MLPIEMNIWRNTHAWISHYVMRHQFQCNINGVTQNEAKNQTNANVMNTIICLLLNFPPILNREHIMNIKSEILRHDTIYEILITVGRRRRRRKNICELSVHVLRTFFSFIYKYMHLLPGCKFLFRHFSLKLFNGNLDAVAVAPKNTPV